jgi:DNA polymerase-1
MKKLLLIDANSLIHRAFHALPPLTDKEGSPTGALYGLAGALIKVLGTGKPDYVAAAFDRPEPTFRKKMFGDYKAHRPKAPDELVSQLIEAHNLFNNFGIKSFEIPGYEADDIIGTLVKKIGGDKNIHTTILTGDLDTLQLVEGQRIVVDILKRGVSETALYDEGAVSKRYGLKPSQMADYKGLVGDPSDNIPGVKGVGPKTAEAWLKKYGSLDDLFEKMPSSDPTAKKILPFKKDALFSKELATINCSAPIEADVEDIKFYGVKERDIVPYLRKKGFESIIRRLGDGTGDEPPTQGLFTFKDRKRKRGEEGVVFIKNGDGATPSRRIGEIDVAWNWKPLIKRMLLKREGVPPRIFDLGVAGWVLNSDEKDFSPEALADRFLERADNREEGWLMEKIFSVLETRIRTLGLENIFYEIEMPLIPVLAQMENWGIGVKRAVLEKLGKKMERELSGLTKKIHAAGGGVFNINSPKQLAEILFRKLGIRAERNKRTGTGQRSTSEEVLTSLKNSHPIIEDILSYRETFKIKSTYIEPLLLALEKDGRIRTNFIQTGTTTGRLASEKPNLQNIPQESRWSSELRRAFVAGSGFSLASFDYAQLELRLLAHMTLEGGLLRAFEANQDIHTATASRVLGIPAEKITKQERRLGKTLNFGVVYGMGPRAFSQSAGVSLSEAKNFIDSYYREFPKVREWQNKVRTEAVKRGVVENLNGRRRWFFVDRRHPNVAGEIERAAVNMPLQSLGADILKMSMIKSAKLLKEEGWSPNRARLILSVHDELLFEIRDDTLMEAIPVIKKLMEEIYPLASPLVTEVRVGKNLGELKATT